jgi:hypothetical protein
MNFVQSIARDCFALGITRAYLCARPARSSFYEGLGWIPIETDIGQDGFTVFIRDAACVNVPVSSPP